MPTWLSSNRSAFDRPQRGCAFLLPCLGWPGGNSRHGCIDVRLLPMCSRKPIKFAGKESDHGRSTTKFDGRVSDHQVTHGVQMKTTQKGGNRAGLFLRVRFQCGYENKSMFRSFSSRGTDCTGAWSDFPQTSLENLLGKYFEFSYDQVSTYSDSWSNGAQKQTHADHL